MDIAFFGSSLVSAYWNGAATYYRGLIRALHARGHRVTFYEPDAYNRQQHRDIPDPQWAKVVVYSAEGTDGVLRCLDAARDADVIVKASGVGVFDALLEQALPAMKRPGNLVVFWDVDAPATLDRMRDNPDDPFTPLVRQYDLILTYGGGDPVVRAYERVGARQCEPIYNALDPATHHPVPPDPRFVGDLGFVANRLPDREQRVEEFFLKPAAMLPAKRFLIGGNGWGDKPMPPNVKDVGHVYTRDHNAFNCSTLAMLNVNRESMARYGFSPATRVFEAAGAAACLITDHFVGVETFFEPNEEILVARNGEEVAEHLNSLSPQRAKEIGQAAYRRALEEHTYDQRAAEVESILDGASSGAWGTRGTGVSPVGAVLSTDRRYSTDISPTRSGNRSEVIPKSDSLLTDFG
jgi:spore maturation protein CgeB